MFIYKFVSKFNNFDDSSTRILRRKKEKGLKDIASNVFSWKSRNQYGGKVLESDEPKVSFAAIIIIRVVNSSGLKQTSFE